MKKFFLLIISTFLFVQLACLSVQAQKRKTTKASKPTVLTAEQIAKQYLPSIVLIVCDDGRGNVSQGSGFVIKEGLVLTNYHVIKDMKRGKIKSVAPTKQLTDSERKRLEAKTGWTMEEFIALYEIEREDEGWIESILYTDATQDLALIDVRMNEKTILKDGSVDLNKSVLSVLDFRPALDLSTNEDVKIGEEVFVLSNPKGLTGTISKGIISSVIRQVNGIEFLQFDAPISQGSSGGAVLNAQGKVVGIATASLESGQNLNFAVPSSRIKSFIEVYEKTAGSLFLPSDSQLSNAWNREVKIYGLMESNDKQKNTDGGETNKQINPPKEQEEKPKITYEEITQDLLIKLKGRSFKDKLLSERVSNIEFSQCSMKFEKVSQTEAETITNSYKVNLGNMENVSLGGYGENIRYITLKFAKNLVLNSEQGGSFVASPIKEIEIPMDKDNKTAFKIISHFEKLKEICGNSRDALSEPTLQQTTDWITNKVQGTIFYSNDLIFKYESLQFSNCNLVFVRRTQAQVEFLETNTINLGNLNKIDVGNNTSGKWGIWLNFSSNFDVVRETFGYFGKKEYLKKDEFTIFFDDSEKAKRVGIAFARLLELCGEEHKEPF